MNRSFIAALGLALALGLGAAATGSASPGEPPSRDAGAAEIEGRYLVVYRDSLDHVGEETERRERRLGFESRYLYRNAIEGFAAGLSPADARALRDDPEVDFVAPDRRVNATATVPLASGEPVPPTGVRRIEAGTTTTVHQASGVNVAVIDTGIQLSHPDLNAADGTDCIDPGTPANDGHSHGTHVAGTIAAKNNGSGVTGVAPGTQAYAVRVLNNRGSGSTSTVVCGIDWVTANAADENIEVANMSLSGTGVPVQSCATTTDPEHAAICNSTEAGVTYVVAAGNDGWDFDFAPAPDVPAAYPEVLTATAVSDSDGKPGGTGGAPSCRPSESDDQEASFSNFAATSGGADHTIAAPGVCIESTLTGSGYGFKSGTSMASPHVAGLAGLLRARGVATTRDAVRERIQSTADRIGGTGRDWSNGRINACRAMTNASTC
jgi:subtilisin